MRKLVLLIVAVAFMSATSVEAQKKVREKDIVGEWKLVIDIDEDAIEDEMDDESRVAKAFASAISGFVIDIVEDIDITMVFHKNHDLEILVEMWGEHEVEEGEWLITDAGELMIIEDDHDKRYDDDDVWLFEDGVLVQYDKKSYGYERDSDNVYMTKVRD